MASVSQGERFIASSSGTERRHLAVARRETRQPRSQGPGLMEAPFRQLLKRWVKTWFFQRTGHKQWRGYHEGANQGQQEEKAGWRDKVGSAGRWLKTGGVFPPSRAGASSKEQTREEPKDGCRGAVVTMLTKP